MKAFALLLACAAAGAQQPPVFQSAAKVVLVDAVVTGKKGEDVRDLTAKDFRVWEDGKEQTHPEPLRSQPIHPPVLSASPRRLVLFFDHSGMDLADQAGAREAAASFIDANAGPNQLMAVVTFDGVVHVAQSFTGNAVRLKEMLRGVSVTVASPDESLLGRWQAVGAPNSARGLIPSVAKLAGNLNAVPGRKLLVLLTGRASFASARPPDVASLVQISNHSNVAVYPVVQGAASQGASGAGFDMQNRPLGWSPAAWVAPGTRNDDVSGGARRWASRLQLPAERAAWSCPAPTTFWRNCRRSARSRASLTCWAIRHRIRKKGSAIR